MGNKFFFVLFMLLGGTGLWLLFYMLAATFCGAGILAIIALLLAALLTLAYMLHKRVEFLEEKLDPLWKEMRQDGKN